MYNIGDKVVYPMYGAGVIVDIEERQTDLGKKYYYVLNMPIGNLKINLSVTKADELGIREIISSDNLKKIILETQPTAMSQNWNDRYKENIERLQSGDVCKVCQVYKTLRIKERQKGLSNAEKKLLSNSKQIILSELILSLNIQLTQAETMLESTTA